MKAQVCCVGQGARQVTGKDRAALGHAGAVRSSGCVRFLQLLEIAGSSSFLVLLQKGAERAFSSAEGSQPSFIQLK